MERPKAAEAADREETGRRLASELHEVDAAIELVLSGAASRVTLNGLRFGEALVARAAGPALTRGVVLEPTYWPEDAGCDLTLRRRDVEH